MSPELALDLILKYGQHKSAEDGMCMLEAASYLADEPFSDHPRCVSPVIAAFGRVWNDGLPSDAERTRLLLPLIPKLIGTRTTEADEETRAWLATDWLVRVQAPAWLDLSGLNEAATRLRALPALTTAEIAIASQPIIDGARSEANSAWDAARNAAANAADKKLAPTVAMLQASAVELFKAMCAVGQ